MKKLMIVAAAAALAGTTFGGIAVKNCASTPTNTCDEVVFKVTASGKAKDAESKDYSTVSKLKISKGALVMWAAGTDSNGDCCYGNYSLYAAVRVGNKTYNVIVATEPFDSWTLFGKKQAEVEAQIASPSKSKKYTLESQLGISLEGDLYDANDLDNGGTITDDDVVFVATAFGKAKVKTGYTKASCNSCGVQTAATSSFDVVPGNYSGWFAGLYTEAQADLCFACDCTDVNVFGGTWKAKFWKSATSWKTAAGYVFGSSVASNMEEAGIE